MSQPLTNLSCRPLAASLTRAKCTSINGSSTLTSKTTLIASQVRHAKHEPEYTDVNNPNFDPEEARRATDQILTGLTSSTAQDVMDQSSGLQSELLAVFNQAEHVKKLQYKDFADYDAEEAELAKAPEFTVHDLLEELGVENPEEMLKNLSEYDRRRLEFAQKQLAETEEALDEELADEEYQYEIAPGSSAAELLAEGVPAREILEFTRGMAIEGLVTPSYKGVNLKHLSRKAVKQREELEARGLSGRYRTFQEIERDNLKSNVANLQDMHDLEDYYNHFADYPGNATAESVEGDKYEDFGEQLREEDMTNEDGSIPISASKKRAKINPPQYEEDPLTSKAFRKFSRTVPMDEPLPKELQKRVNFLLSDVDYKKARDDHFFMNDLEMWYIANRLPVVYSIMKRIMTEILHRIPGYKPQTIMEFAAGASPGLWAARDVFYHDFAKYFCIERDPRLALLGQQLTADLGIHILYRPKLVLSTETKKAAVYGDYNKFKSKRDKKTGKKKVGESAREAKMNLDNAAKEQQFREKKDLVIVPYALSKQPNREYRQMLLDALWEHVNPNGGLLILIESTQDVKKSGFHYIQEARDYLLKKYPKANIEDTKIANVQDSDASDAAPEWAQGATVKRAHEQEPSASSILPCAHDRPCPIGTMQKLYKEFVDLRRLGRKQGIQMKLPRVPVTSCSFGQRMLRGPMPNQSPLQDIKVPRHLGDAILENFSYVVMRRGEPSTVKEDDVNYKVYPGQSKLTTQEELEARKLALDIMGVRSVDNIEQVEHLKKKTIKENLGKYGKLNQQVEESERKEVAQYFDKDGIIIREKVEELAKEMGIELDEDTYELFKEELDSKYTPKTNPRKLFVQNRWSRVVSPPLKRGGHVVLDLCTPEGHIERRVVGKEGVGWMGFRHARSGKWGDVWPYKRAITVRELKEKKRMEEIAKKLNIENAEDMVDKLSEMKRLFSPTLGKDDLELMSLYNTPASTDPVGSSLYGDAGDGTSTNAADGSSDQHTSPIEDLLAQVEEAIMAKQKALDEAKSFKQVKQANMDFEDAAAYLEQKEQEYQAALRTSLTSSKGMHLDEQQQQTKKELLDLMMNPMDEEELFNDDDDISDSEYEALFDADKTSGLDWKSNQLAKMKHNKNAHTNEDELDFEPQGALDGVDESSTVKGRLKLSRARRGIQEDLDYNDYIVQNEDGETTISIDVDKQQKQAKYSSRRSPSRRSYSTSTSTGNNVMSRFTSAHHNAITRTSALSTTFRSGGNTFTNRRNLLTITPPPTLTSIDRTFFTSPYNLLIAKHPIGCIVPTQQPRYLSTKPSASSKIDPVNEAILAKAIVDMDPDVDTMPRVVMSSSSTQTKAGSGSAAGTGTTPSIPKGMIFSSQPIVKPTKKNIKPGKVVDPFSTNPPVRRVGLIESVLRGGVKEVDPLEPRCAMDSTAAKDNITGNFRFDGVMGPTSQYAQMKTLENAQKLRAVATIPVESLPHIHMNADPVDESDLEAMRDKTYDEGILKRDGPAMDFSSKMTFKALLEHIPKDEAETMKDELHKKNQLDSVTRTDRHGHEVQGQIEQTLNRPDRKYRSQLEDLSRKLKSREKLRKFRERLEQGKKAAVEEKGGVYTPPPMDPKVANAMKSYILQTGGTSHAKLTGTVMEDKLRRDIAEIKAKRAEAVSKNLIFTGVDYIAQEQDFTPSLKAKTATEKRASLAQIESHEEHEARKELKEMGLDLSLTALLTNRDGYGPQMDPLTGRRILNDYEAPTALQSFTADDLEDLDDYADEYNKEKAKTIIELAQKATKTANGQPLKLKLQRKKVDREENVPVTEPVDDTEEIIEYNIEPLLPEEQALLEQHQQEHRVFTLHDGTTLDSEVVEAFAKAQEVPQSFTSLTQHFRELVKKEEEKDLLAAHTFTPIDVPTMSDAYTAKTRDPDNMGMTREMTGEFAFQNRNYDSLMTDFQEAELLEKLGAFNNVKLPEGTFGGAMPGTADVPEKMTKQAKLEELRLALDFERSLQEATKEVYSVAKKKIRQQVKSGDTNFLKELEKDPNTIDIHDQEPPKAVKKPISELSSFTQPKSTRSQVNNANKEDDDDDVIPAEIVSEKRYKPKKSFSLEQFNKQMKK